MILLRRLWRLLRAVPGWAWGIVAAVVAGWRLRGWLLRARSAQAALGAERQSADATERARLSVADAEARAERLRRAAVVAERREIAVIAARRRQITEAAASGHEALAAELNAAMADTDPDVPARTEEDTQP